MGDETVQGIDFGAFAAHEVLASGGERFRDLRGDFSREGEGLLRIGERTEMNAGSLRDFQDFDDGAFYKPPGFNISGDAAVLGAAQRRDGVERAIGDELGPELGMNVFGDANGNVGASEKIG